MTAVCTVCTVCTVTAGWRWSIRPCLQTAPKPWSVAYTTHTHKHTNTDTASEPAAEQWRVACGVWRVACGAWQGMDTGDGCRRWMQAMHPGADACGPCDKEHGCATRSMDVRLAAWSARLPSHAQHGAVACNGMERVFAWAWSTCMQALSLKTQRLHQAVRPCVLRDD